MKRIKTGTIILGIIAAIFGIDTVLSINNDQTISEWFYHWIHSDQKAVLIYVSISLLVFFHFWWFRPEKRDELQEDITNQPK